jgi:hypothetical protein
VSTPANLADRYGRPADARAVRRSRRRVALIAGSLVALLVAWILWTDQLGFGPTTTWEDTTHTLVNDSTVTVEFRLTATPGHQVACAIQAQDKAFTVVGWKVVVYPASTQSVRSFTESVTTIGPATTGLVGQCWLT